MLHTSVGKKKSLSPFDAVSFTQPEGCGWPTYGTGRGNDHGVLVKCQQGDLKSTTLGKDLVIRQ